MATYPAPLARLIEELERLPGIGPKSAQRMAFHILTRSREDARRLAEAIATLKDSIRRCSVCFNYTEDDPCAVCRDPGRDRSLLCVVSDPRDVIALENAQEYRGLYHILGGLISPLDDIGPEQLTIGQLINRVKEGEAREVILATNPTVEGDSTAHFLAEQLRPLGVKVTRIALGLPVGGDLDYADQMTVARAMQGRTEM